MSDISRVIEKGGLLSPLLFALISDVLSLMFKNTLSSVTLYGVPLSSLNKMCHLQYTNDLLILTIGGMEDLRIIKLILHLFEGISCMVINLRKISI